MSKAWSSGLWITSSHMRGTHGSTRVILFPGHVICALVSSTTVSTSHGGVADIFSSRTEQDETGGTMKDEFYLRKYSI